MWCCASASPEPPSRDAPELMETPVCFDEEKLIGQENALPQPETRQASGSAAESPLEDARWRRRAVDKRQFSATTSGRVPATWALVPRAPLSDARLSRSARALSLQRVSAPGDAMARWRAPRRGFAQGSSRPQHQSTRVSSLTDRRL